MGGNLEREPFFFITSPLYGGKLPLQAGVGRQHDGNVEESILPPFFFRSPNTWAVQGMKWDGSRSVTGDGRLGGDGTAVRSPLSLFFLLISSPFFPGNDVIKR